MTKRELIEIISNEMTSFGNLPVKLKDDDISKLIDKEMKYLYRNDRELLQDLHCVIDGRWFQTQEFLSRRTIQFPDCIVGVFRFMELGKESYGLASGLMDMTAGPVAGIGNISDDGSGFGMYLSPWSTDTVAFNTVRWSVWDLLRSFALTDINYNFNLNTHRIIVTGRTPYNPVFVSAIATIPEESAYEDPYVQLWLGAKAKQHLARTLGLMTPTLLGGTQINVSVLTEPANAEIQECKDYFKGINAPDYMVMTN